MNDQQLLSELFDRIKTYLEANSKADKAVLEFQTPSKLEGIIDFSIANQGVTEQTFIQLIDNYLTYSVRTGHKQFFNQLYSGFNLPAFIGDICSGLANTSMYTFEVAPVASLIESEMIKLMNRYVGYKNGDGTFLTGGSNANLVAMFTARNTVLPDVASEGYDKNTKLTVFISEHAHYSFETAANLLGLGANSVKRIKSDSKGKMLVTDLRNKIQASISRGEQPFFVAATCATTVMGAYDPLDEIANVCEEHSLWLHADGSFGGSIILSDKHRHLLSGIEKTDSFAWNPHKLMNIPLICSVLLINKIGALESNITDIHTDYIYHDNDDTQDLGIKSIQCGRSVDAVKLWFAWKYFGLDGYQQRIDNLIAMAEYAESIVLRLPQLELVAPRQSFTVCFRYIPFADLDINAFNLSLREYLRKAGKTMVNFTKIGDLLTIRLVTANGELSESDIDLFFQHILQGADHLQSSAS